MMEKKVSAKKNTVILTISLSLLLIVNNCIGGVKDYIYTSIINFFENKTIYVNYVAGDYKDEEIEKFIEQQEGVLGYFDYGMEDVGVKRLKLDGKQMVGFIHVEPYDSDVLNDYMITKSVDKLEDNEMIVGKYANFTTEWLEDIGDDTEIIDMEAYIGKELTCVLHTSDAKESKTYTFRIVGVFDNIKAGKTSPFYINDEVRQEMLDLCDYHMIEIDDMGNEEKIETKYYQVIAKNNETALKLANELRSRFKGIGVLRPTIFPEKLLFILNGIIIVGDFIILFIIFNSISNIIYVTEDNLKKRRREFGILKAIGYKNKDMRNILLKESLMSSAKAIGISGTLGMLLFAGMRWYVNNNMSIYFRSLSFSTKPHTFLLYFSIAIGVPLIGFTYGYKRLKNITAVDALRSE